MTGLLDSGAFSDPPEKRLTEEGALQRQLAWEKKAERWWGAPWQAEALVSYDLLIDEKWTAGKRKKQRWSVQEADRAIETTVSAARYLAGQREAIAPRRCVLACQGVDAGQYRECASAVLEVARPGDWLGLGGWCILGWHTSWLPTFWASMRAVLPLAHRAGIDRAHIFGVMYRPALGGLLWLADQYGITISTDSSGPVLAVTWKNTKKAGAVKPTWEENAAWWRNELCCLRNTDFYREPPAPHSLRQNTLFREGA